MNTASFYIAASIFAMYLTFATMSVAIYLFLPVLQVPRSWFAHAGDQIVSLWHAEVKAIEWFSGTLMILWSLWLLPSNAFSIVPSVYFGMASVGSEAAWGAVLLFIGICHGLARLLPCPHWIRKGTMLAVTAGWLSVAIPLISLGWTTTAAPIYASLVGISLWAYLREATTYQRAQRMIVSAQND